MMLVNAIWDLDGTLFNTYPEMLKALTTTLRAAGAKIDPKQLLEAIKRTSIKDVTGRYARQLGTTQQQLSDDYHALEHQTVMTAKPYPQAKAVLEKVASKGGHNLLMTHRDHSAWALLRQAKLRDLFLGGVTAELDLPRKPQPDAILYLLQRFQLNPKRTAMIGDRRLDVVAGNRAGVTSIYFDVDRLSDAPMASKQIETLDELLKIF